MTHIRLLYITLECCVLPIKVWTGKTSVQVLQRKGVLVDVGVAVAVAVAVVVAVAE
jgi:hypothetical protein